MRKFAVEWTFHRGTPAFLLSWLLAAMSPALRAQNPADAQIGVLQVWQNCRQPSRITAEIRVCNAGNRPIPAGTPISFYTSDPRLPGANSFAATYNLPLAIAGGTCRALRIPLRVTDGRADSFYVVINDNGRSLPFRLPNTGLKESDYENNISLATGFRFRATVRSNKDTVQRGDSVRLSATFKNGLPGSFNWLPGTGLSCTGCRMPRLHILKDYQPARLITVSREGCRDTSFSRLYVIPQADYAVTVDSVVCAGDGRGYVHFRFCDNSTTGLLPDSIPIAFYQGDPAAGKLIGKPVVYHPVPGSRCAADSFLFEKLFPGIINAVIHDTLLPAAYHFPSGGRFDEDELANNVAAFDYALPSLQIFPADTTVIRGSAVPLRFRSSLSGIVSCKWITTGRTTIDCNDCQAPVTYFLDSSEIRAQVRTAYGCAVEARARLNVYPPDFTCALIESHCYKNDSLLIRFSICSNNGYDSVPAGLPVSFSGLRDSAAADVLSPPFYHLSTARAGTCAEYQLVVPKPAGSWLSMKVNDIGMNSPPESRLLQETNRENNEASLQIIPFRYRLSSIDTTVYRGTELNLLPESTGDAPEWVNWEPSLFLTCSQCPSTIVKPGYDITYRLTAVTANGCTDSSRFSVHTEVGSLLNIPNAFSPNGDGHNDIFYVTGKRELVLVKEFSIYNRNGELVLARAGIPANDPAFGWDGNFRGRRAPEGGYLYFVSVVFSGGKEEQRSGTVLLLR